MHAPTVERKRERERETLLSVTLGNRIDLFRSLVSLGGDGDSVSVSELRE